MAPSNNELIKRIQDMETILNGPPSDPGKGLLPRVGIHDERIKMVEKAIDAIQKAANRIIWLLISGVIVGLLNLLWNSHPPQQDSISQSTTVSATDAAPPKKELPSRGYYTAAEFAEAQKPPISTREADKLLLENRVAGAVKVGKSYQIPFGATIIPKNEIVANRVRHDAAPGGPVPQDAAPDCIDKNKP